MLGFFLFLSCTIEIAAMVFWWNGKNNLPLLHVYVAAGFIVLAGLYGQVLRDFISRRILFVVMILFLLFTLLNSIFIQNIFTFNSYALTAESILVIIFSFFTLVLSQHEVFRDKQNKGFASIRWINAGLLIYYSSSLLLFYFGDIVNKSFPVYLSQYTWLLSNFFSAVMYTCFIVALWKRPQM